MVPELIDHIDLLCYVMHFFKFEFMMFLFKDLFRLYMGPYCHMKDERKTLCINN